MHTQCVEYLNGFLYGLYLHTCISRAYCNLVWFRIWSLVVFMTALLYHFSFTDHFTCMFRNLTSILIWSLYFYKYLSNYWFYSSGNVSWVPYYLEWPLRTSVQHQVVKTLHNVIRLSSYLPFLLLVAGHQLPADDSCAGGQPFLSEVNPSEPHAHRGFSANSENENV